MKHWLLAMILSACGGSQAQDPEQPIPGSSDAGPSELTAPSSSAADALSDQECEALFAHVFQIAFADQQQSLPEEERPTQADMDKAKGAMREELLGQCIGASRVGFHYDCAIAATNRAGLQACVGAK